MNLHIRPLRRRTRRERVLKAARDLELPSGLGSKLRDMRPPRTVKSGATAVASATAASAAISAVRRRLETPRGDG